jgi:hypothetical protein
VINETPQIPLKLDDAFSVAIVPNRISLAIAMPRAIQVDPHVTYTGSKPLTVMDTRVKASPAKDIVSPGMAHQAATRVPLVNEGHTFAPYAVRPHMPPNNATLSHDLLAVKTPFIADEWERMLNRSIPFNKFSDVPISMRFGFDMGVRYPPVYTFTPPNHNSSLLYPEHVLAHIHTELSLGRYSGPFSRSRLEALIGPFRSSPLGTVPKSLGSTQRRIVQDLSFPRNDSSLSSINSQINIDDFRCDWGTFNDVRNIVIDAPTLSEAATLDVDSAFRCCPITPSQQRNFIVQWDDKYYIDHNAPFGATSAGGAFGRVADAKTAILVVNDIGPSKNWVDDFVFFRFPISVSLGIPSFSYSLIDIYNLASRLGWPWKESKTRPFAPEFKYLGFVWDLSSKTVQIPNPKKALYLVKLQPWIGGKNFSRKDTESLLGTLVHCSLALPDGRSHLPSISRFAASFNHFSSPFVHRTPNASVLSDIQWWRTRLTADFCGSVLSRPPPASNIEFWVDASTSWGIGVVFGNEWDFWKLKPGWEKDGRNIGWAEMVAIELGLLFVIFRSHTDIHFIVKSDNQGVIHAIQGGKSRSPEQNSVLQRITFLLSQYKIHISSVYVPSADNLADRPSRGLPLTTHTRADLTFTLPPSLIPFLVRPSLEP